MVWISLAGKARLECAPKRAISAAGFTPLRGVWKEGPDAMAYAFRVDTDQGWRAALLFPDGGLLKRYGAALVAHGHEPASTLTLSRATFDEIVPATKD